MSCKGDFSYTPTSSSHPHLGADNPAHLEEARINVSNVDVTQAIDNGTVKMKSLIRIEKDADLRTHYEDLNALESVYQVKLTQP